MPTITESICSAQSSQSQMAEHCAGQSDFMFDESSSRNEICTTHGKVSAEVLLVAGSRRIPPVHSNPSNSTCSFYALMHRHHAHGQPPSEEQPFQHFNCTVRCENNDAAGYPGNQQHDGPSSSSPKHKGKKDAHREQRGDHGHIGGERWSVSSPVLIGSG